MAQNFSFTSFSVLPTFSKAATSAFISWFLIEPDNISNQLQARSN